MPKGTKSGRRRDKADRPAGARGDERKDAIRSAKYLPRELPRRFEEERFIFPDRVLLPYGARSWYVRTGYRVYR